MNTSIKDELIKDYENKVNEKINTLYDIFYIQPYNNGKKYGVMFNGNMIALCRDLIEVENVVNTIIYFLDRGGLKR